MFQGLEITTGGQRLHLREDLEAALRSRSIDRANFESHLAMFDLGMPPHGGFAIGLERLTCQVLNLQNVRQAVIRSNHCVQATVIINVSQGHSTRDPGKLKYASGLRRKP